MMAAERRRVEEELIQPAHAAGLPPPVAQAASRSGKRAATRKGIFRAVAIADGQTRLLVLRFSIPNTPHHGEDQPCSALTFLGTRRWLSNCTVAKASAHHVLDGVEDIRIGRT